MDSGNAAEWANAVVTAFALGAAGWAALSTHRTLKVERERDQRQVEAERAAQASLVAAWIEEKRGTSSCVVVNNSKLPVFNAAVRFHSAERPDDQPSKEFAVLPPGRQEVSYPDEWRVPTEQDPYSGETSSAEGVTNLYASVMFTDTAGAAWLRTERGQLSLVRGHDADWFARSN